MSDVSANKTLVKFPRWKVKDGFRSEYFLGWNSDEEAPVSGARMAEGSSSAGHLPMKTVRRDFLKWFMPMPSPRHVILLFLQLQFGFFNN